MIIDQEKQPLRRLKLVKIYRDIFPWIFLQGEKFEIEDGLPIGAKCVGVNYDPETCVLVLAFEHETFDEVAAGEKVPVMDIQIKRLNPPWQNPQG